MPEKDQIKTLYRKYRPAVWAEVKYQDHIVTTLKNAIAADKVGQAYIFSGPRGTGKTTAARLLAKAVNCQHEDAAHRPCGVCPNCVAISEGHFIDLIEIDAASHTGVDDARDLIDKVMFTPNIGRKKVYIIDEVHMLSKAAFNALLKTIEEPPPHVIFILATTELDKVMPTILSRCQRFEFRRFPLQDIAQHLAGLCKAENIEADEDALLSIARNSAGGMRDAISLLDQLSGTGEKLTLDLVQRVLGTAANEAVMQTIDAIIQHDPATAITLAHEVLDRGASAQSYSRQLIEHLRNIMLVKTKNAALLDVTENVKEVIVRQASQVSLLQVIEYIKELNQAITDKQAGVIPGLAIETSLAKLAGSVLDPSPQTRPNPVTTGSAPIARHTQEPVAQPAQAIAKQEPAVKPAEPQTKQQPAAAQDSNDETGSGSTQMVQPSTPKPSNSAVSNINMETINEAWGKVRDQLAIRDKNYLALYRDSQVIDFTDKTVVIGFKSEILAKKFDEHKERSFVTEQFQQVLGPAVTVRTGVIGSNAGGASGGGQGGLIDEALNLGGKLVK